MPWSDGSANLTTPHGAAYVPASARRVLARFDERAAHYEVREGRDASAAAQ